MADAGQWGHLLQPCTAGDLKKNTYGMLKDRPCKIVEVRTSKTGKHGHAKCSMTGIDVLTGKKIQDVQPSHAQMYFAVVEKRDLQLLVLEDDHCSCLDDESNEINVSLEGCTCLEALKAAYENPVEDQDIFVSLLSAPEPVGAEITKKEIIVDFRQSAENNK